MIDAPTLAKAEAVLDACRARGLTVATAESCTGGLVAAALTAIAGSSDVVERGFVTYSNKAKIELLGVQGVEIATVGVVSEEVARAMAQGALARSPAALSVAVTGIAGPGGGSDGKPVGLVWFGCARRGGSLRTLRHVFPGDRAAVRTAATEQALDLLLEAALASP
jgi:nicotinamide-nucleotide amidase